MKTLSKPQAPILSAVAAAAALACIGGLALSAATPDTDATAPAPIASTAAPSPSTTVPETPTPVLVPSAAQLEALPEARYDAVIAGLLPFDGTLASDASASVYRLADDLALYGEDRVEPVARLAAWDFTAEQTVTVAAAVDGEWTLVLTPARQSLPSQNGGTAPAQSAAWVLTTDLPAPETVEAHVTASISDQTVTVRNGDSVETYSAAVGRAGTPTPTGTGYLEARFSDPSQANGEPIQLTSLHSAVADEPYRGDDGGLIAIHWSENTVGASSHGCVRVDTQALTALSGLPTGTPITITD
ncbi:L,D-transpeptidase [Microbacterium esteraromaticum]|uniref:L,D-transpeptidase n=1 Tax=Microbacterium esteraromaticum TaxID=57043 RepID=UPI0023688610|nr:L,D-transpeptidase [Microbacterium esteraromaticum]WDH78243.1 L,D-transpeptidase [Microbacterium esteraromaticum]